MANSRTLLVYVLALVVCGSNTRFWVSASTAPLGSVEPLIGTTAAAPPQQTRPQQHYVQFHQQQAAQQSQKQESLSSQSPSSLQTIPSSSPQYQRTSLNTNNGPSTMMGKNGFGFSVGNSRSGPYTAGYGYIQGRTLNQPSSGYVTDYDVQQQQVSEAKTGSFFSGVGSLMPDFGTYMHGNVDMKSVILGALLGSAATMFSPGGKFGSIFPAVREAVREELKVIPELKVKAPIPASNSTSDDEEDTSSSRRRRRDVEFDTDLTELAAMVLSAIQSGECMQRSICLLGSRIGKSEKGKMGFLVVDKLIPESVQGSQYFVTLKKALRGGESYCDRFRCRFN